jgi:hypothetical protein
MNVTPSTKPVTAGQIGKLNAKIAARLLKHNEEFPSNLFQKALADDKIIDEIFNAIHKRAGVMVKTITIQGCDIEVIFFKPAYKMYDHELEKEYDLRELEPLDYSLFIKLNKEMEKDDPQFFSKFPNATHWKNDDNKSWSFAGFERDNNCNGKAFSYGYREHGLSTSTGRVDPFSHIHPPCRNNVRGWFDTVVNNRWEKTVWFVGVRKTTSAN